MLFVSLLAALVDVLTVRDLRGIGNNANRFKRLFLSVKAFKEYTRYILADLCSFMKIKYPETNSAHRHPRLLCM